MVTALSQSVIDAINETEPARDPHYAYAYALASSDLYETAASIKMLSADQMGGRATDDNPRGLIEKLLTVNETDRHMQSEIRNAYLRSYTPSWTICGPWPKGHCPQPPTGWQSAANGEATCVYAHTAFTDLIKAGLDLELRYHYLSRYCELRSLPPKGILWTPENEHPRDYNWDAIIDVHGGPEVSIEAKGHVLYHMLFVDAKLASADTDQAFAAEKLDTWYDADPRKSNFLPLMERSMQLTSAAHSAVSRVISWELDYRTSPWLHHCMTPETCPRNNSNLPF